MIIFRRKGFEMISFFRVKQSIDTLAEGIIIETICPELDPEYSVYPKAIILPPDLEKQTPSITIAFSSISLYQLALQGGTLLRGLRVNRRPVKPETDR